MTDTEKEMVKLAEGSLAMDASLVKLCETLVNRVVEMSVRIDTLERRLDAMLHLYYDRFDKDSTVL